MKTMPSIRIMLVAVIAVGALCAIGPGATVAYFDDTHTGNGAFSAAVDYSTNPGNGNGPGNGGGNGPPNGQPFNDADGDGEYDSGEQTFSSEELGDFDHTSANLIIPDGLETIETSGQDDVSIRAGNITSGANISTQKGAIDLEATNGSVVFEDGSVSANNGQGDVDVTALENVSFAGSTVSTKKGAVDVNAGGAVNLDQAIVSISNDGGALSVTGASISAVDATLDTKKQPIDLTATAGGIDLSDGSVTVNNGQGNVDISATDDVFLISADLSTQKGGIEVGTGGVLNLDSASIQVTNGQASVALSGWQISAIEAQIDTKKGGISLVATASGGGPIDATDADFAVANGQSGISLESIGDTTLDDASLVTKNGPATVNLGTSSATLSVHGTTIDDSDGTLVYDPDDISVVGSASNQTSP